MTMDSQIKVYTHPNGDIQRVQLVRLDSWEQLEFAHMDNDSGALDHFAHIYRSFLVPACPWIFGNLILFQLPEGLEVPFSRELTGKVTTAHPLTAAAAALEKGVRFTKGKPRFRNDRIRQFWQTLEEQNCIRLVRGRLPFTTVIPVGNRCGYLSRQHPDARLKVNASFFIMASFDCATVHDHVGTVLGLCVKDGVITSPPLFRREALLVSKDGTVRIGTPCPEDLAMEIAGQTFHPGVNARVYSRPEYAFTPPVKGKKLAVIGNTVSAVSCRAVMPVPASGFVLCVDDSCPVSPGDSVAYRGMEDIVFGIQVGNSIIREGEKTLRFLSRFYNIYRLQPVPFPPSLYPMDFDNARAARIALGADREGRPMLLWAEGAAKIGHLPGKDSRGASLLDMAQICADLGFANAVNLDGGGSAQILLHNRRSLRISDRNADGSEAERPVPLALIVK